ncbi:MAG: hypothetical protein VSS75_029755 [Candidatus Parabeggiatoa sp.]|nr:hypothetical protein [Candidatus Parabeggiatoa sp.]
MLEGMLVEHIALPANFALHSDLRRVKSGVSLLAFRHIQKINYPTLFL